MQCELPVNARSGLSSGELIPTDPLHFPESIKAAGAKEQRPIQAAVKSDVCVELPKGWERACPVPLQGGQRQTRPGDGQCCSKEHELTPESRELFDESSPWLSRSGSGIAHQLMSVSRTDGQGSEGGNWPSPGDELRVLT